jgi:hypothetical protein
VPVSSHATDETLVSDGDLVGKTAAEIRTPHFARDRGYLRRG